MSGSRLADPPHLHRTIILSTPLRCSSNSAGGSMASLRSLALDSMTVLVAHFSQVQIGSGTPQYLCLDMTQSRAPLSQSLNRFDPAQSGTHRIFMFSLIIFDLKLVTRRNHWSVARRIRGVLHRQQ